MGFIAAKCPQCTAELILENGRDHYFCSYCGSKIVYERQNVEVPSVESLTILGFREIECNDDGVADEHFDEALKIYPDDTGAIIGKCLVGKNQRQYYFHLLKQKHPQISDLEKSLITVETAPYFVRTYAEGKDKNRLEYVFNHFLNVIIDNTPDFFDTPWFYGPPVYPFDYSADIIDFVIDSISFSTLPRGVKLINIFGSERPNSGLYSTLKRKNAVSENIIKRFAEIIKNNSFTHEEVFDFLSRKAINTNPKYGFHINAFSSVQLPLGEFEALLLLGLDSHAKVEILSFDNGKNKTQIEFYRYLDQMVEKKRTLFGIIESKKRTEQYDKKFFHSTDCTPEDYLSLLEKSGY